MDCKDQKNPRNEDLTCQNTDGPTREIDSEIEQEKQMQSDEYKVILSLLQKCGKLAKSEPTRDTKGADDEMHQVFRHNTEKILQCYRRYVWELQSACFECAEELALPLEKVTEYLKNADVTEDPTARHIAYRSKSLYSSKKLIDYVNKCLTRLRTMPAVQSRGSRKSLDGETLYHVLKLTYLFPDDVIQENNGIPPKKKTDVFYSPTNFTRDEIIQEYGGSRRAYYAHRKIAIEELSVIMWGGSSEFVTTLSRLLEEVDV